MENGRMIQLVIVLCHLFSIFEHISFEKQLYAIEVKVSTNECIWFLVHQDRKSTSKYDTTFDTFDEIKFHNRLSSLKINPLL